MARVDEGVEAEPATALPWGTWLLATVCIALYIVATVAGGADRMSVQVRLGANLAPLTVAGQWFRLLACTFLTVGFVHLVVTLAALLAVAPPLERRVGAPHLLAVYTCVALCGSLAGAFWQPTSALVQVGATSALLGVSTVLAWVAHTRPLPPRGTAIALATLAVNVLYAAFATGLDGAAAVGGLAGGVAFVVLLGSVPERAARASALVVALAALPFANEAFTLHWASQHAALSTAPTVTWRDASGQLAFEHSVMLEAKPFDKPGTRSAVRLTSDSGMELVVALYPGDARIDPSRPASALERFGGVMKVDGHDVTRVGERDWLVVYAHQEDQKVAVAVAGNSRSHVCIFTRARNAEAAEALKEMMRIGESLRTD